jgi:superfamily I DNA/RNA helicase
MRLGVPYKVVGGTRFYDRREVKDAMAYLRAVVNPVDEVSVKRVNHVRARWDCRRVTSRGPTSTRNAERALN